MAINAASAPLTAALFNVLPLFALRLGAQVSALGVLNALLWVTDIFQFLSVPWMKRHVKKDWFAVWLLAAALSFTTLFLLPLVPAGAGISPALLYLAGVVTLYNVFLSLGLAAYSPYVRETIPLAVTGEFLGKVTALNNGGVLLSTLIASLFLAGNPELWRYYAFFALAALAAYARAFMASRLPADRGPTGVQEAGAGLRSLLGPLKEPSNRSYTLVVVAVTALWSLPVPLFTPFLSRAAGLPDFVVVLTRAGTMLAPFLLGRFIGRMVDRRGFRMPMAGALALGALSSTALALHPTGAPVLPQALLGLLILGCFGIGNATSVTTLGRERFARSRPPFDSEFLGLTNAGIGIGATVGSVVGGLLPGLAAAWAGSDRQYQVTFFALAILFLMAGAGAMLYRQQGDLKSLKDLQGLE